MREKISGSSPASIQFVTILSKIQKESLVLLCCKKNYFIQINHDIDSDKKPTYWLRDSQQLDLNAYKRQPQRQTDHRLSRKCCMVSKWPSSSKRDWYKSCLIIRRVKTTKKKQRKQQISDWQFITNTYFRYSLNYPEN